MTNETLRELGLMNLYSQMNNLINIQWKQQHYIKGKIGPKPWKIINKTLSPVYFKDHPDIINTYYSITSQQNNFTQ